ncbi:MAG TPA: hypothetical protein VNZ64_22265 [Candidatus Acidoferrum sp.]|jgi:hypothetical protein|nr:hypothetical protein [Candidatus Acidoferrum sp.]
MLTPEELLERVEVQKQDLIGLLMDDAVTDVLAGKINPLFQMSFDPPPLALAIPFTDALILCPTDEAAKSCVMKDMPGARAFINVAEVAIGDLKKGVIRLRPQRSEQQTRFYLLASVVQEYLEAQQRNR